MTSLLDRSYYTCHTKDTSQSNSTSSNGILTHKRENRSNFSLRPGFGHKFREMVWLCVVRGENSICSDLFDAAGKNHVSCLEHALLRSLDHPSSDWSWGPPLSANQNPFAINMRNFNGPSQSLGSPSLCEIAARYGHIDFLRCARENGCPWDVATAFMASRNGHLECLKYATENNCPGGEILHFAAASGDHVECMTYAHETGSPLHPSIPGLAALFGSLSCLRYALEHGCPRCDGVLITAAQRGHLECVNYLLKKGFVPNDDIAGLPIIKNTLVQIASEREAAAVVIQSNWLRFLYRPGSQWKELLKRKRRFTDMQ